LPKKHNLPLEPINLKISCKAKQQIALSRSPIKMDRGSERRSIFDGSQGPTDSRFEALNLNPKIHAKYPYHDCPDFKRYVPRDTGELVSTKRPVIEKRPMPDYNPKRDTT